tara:strand:+ start:1311 stop:1529 length:219 start_codon:yes stop_codon:yes gene_type:complete
MKLGNTVQVEFWDHCKGATEPMRFYVWGRVSKINKHYVVIQTWANTDNLENDHNVETFCLLRSCIEGVTVLS